MENKFIQNNYSSKVYLAKVCKENVAIYDEQKLYIFSLLQDPNYQRNLVFCGMFKKEEEKLIFCNSFGIKIKINELIFEDDINDGTCDILFSPNSEFLCVDKRTKLVITNLLTKEFKIAYSDYDRYRSICYFDKTSNFLCYNNKHSLKMIKLES